MKNIEISGNFNTSTDEKEVVRIFIEQHVKSRDWTSQCQISKFGESKDETVLTNAIGAGDVLVVYPDKTQALYEVKRESAKRFSRYHELALDFISMFHFKDEASKREWKGAHKASEIKEFLKTIDRNDPHLKWGKLMYSYSDVWLFYVQNDDGTYQFLEGYNAGALLQDKNFWDRFFKSNCSFMINNKSKDQMSYHDTWESAALFVSPEFMKPYRIPSDKIIRHGMIGLPA